MNIIANKKQLQVPIEMARVICHLTSESSSNIIQHGGTVSILHAYNIRVTSLMHVPTHVHAL